MRAEQKKRERKLNNLEMDSQKKSMNSFDLKSVTDIEIIYEEWIKLFQFELHALSMQLKTNSTVKVSWGNC